MAARTDRRPPIASFCVLRAPLLPLATFSEFAEGVTASEALDQNDPSLERRLAGDRELTRARLAAWADDPQVREAITVSSPDLAVAIERWRADPHSRSSRSVERSLVRYLARLTARPDLYGLAGTYTIGRFGTANRLTLGPRSEIRRRAGVDSGVLRDVVRKASNDAHQSDELAVRRNPALYRVGGRLRVAARVPGESRHRLVGIRPTSRIEAALEFAGDGAAVGAIVAELGRNGADALEARALVARLIANDILVPALEVAVTGAEPVVQAIAALETIPQAARALKAVRSAAEAVAQAARLDVEVIDRVVAAIEPTAVAVSRRRSVQVDSVRPGEIELPAAVIAEMRRSIDLLTRIAPRALPRLGWFTDAFQQRFGTRSVPVLEALDPDCGIRLSLRAQPGGGNALEPARRRALLDLVERGRDDAAGAVELTDLDVKVLDDGPAVPLPGSFAMLTSLATHGAGDIAAGEFQLVEPQLRGPSGVRLLGRLCHGDPELRELVVEHLRSEAALDPDAIFAEMTVCPETEVGFNVTRRPQLRDWEIEYGGGSGAPREQVLKLSDLYLTVEDGIVVLRSHELGRRVIPTLTAAVNTRWLSLPAAHLMLYLASQGVSSSVAWGWGDLSDAPHLPRVTRGSTILALRRWNVTSAELEQLDPGTDAAGFRRLQNWRAKRGIPRLVGFDHPRSTLLVDFDNVLSVDAFLADAKGLEVIRFVEVIDADFSPILGADGSFAHELIVPFTLSELNTPRPARRRRRAAVSQAQRRFPPGSEWLYANLHGPAALADRVLTDAIAPLVAQLRAEELIDGWFFIRYSDPDTHLRVRFHGGPGVLVPAVLPLLHDATASALADGLLHRISIDTYEREVERYGGLGGVQLMEAAAEADSDAVVELLHHPAGAAERRHLAVASLAALYADAGLGMERSRACSAHLRATWSAGYAPLGVVLGRDERSERDQVASAIGALDDDGSGAAVAALRARSAGLAPLLEQLRALEDDGSLERPLDDVMGALAHMFVNRLLRRGGNHDELRVHDALARYYDGQIARARAGSRS